MQTTRLHEPANNAAPGLRPGQEAALRGWASALRDGVRTELVVVPVGYGKTVIGVGSFDIAANIAGADTCLYLTPTDVLRTQVYRGVGRALQMLGSTRRVGKLLAQNNAPARMLDARVNFIVATYQQVAASPGVYRKLCRARRVHLVCDEAHHLGERGQWAGAIETLGARSTLMLSATPVRLDREAIGGARYTPDGEGGLVIDPLVNVSMRQAWKEGGILKHLQMQIKDYAVQLLGADGEIYDFTASEMASLPDFDQRCVRQQLRWNDDYVEPLVREFATTLQAKLANSPGNHQGLVFAATTEHANHLERVFAQHHPTLRCVVVHSGEISDGENERRLRDFHTGRYDVLIQVRKASEGFDAPSVSVLLKLDAVYSREPVIQQLGRGLRFNHALPRGENVLHAFVGRDPRLSGIIEHLERELPPPPVQRRAEGAAIGEIPAEDEKGLFKGEEDEERDAPEIVDVMEAGDAYVDHTGHLTEGQQMTMFGVTWPRPAVAVPQPEGAVVEDIAGELQEAIDYCKTWTNRAARERAKRQGRGENHHAALNLAYTRASGKRGTLATVAEYRAKGDWMKRRYAEMIG
ncbi:DEAD/DEAH box helicase family protein [bacterium]|nr:DEAD/DEAH box helicase family protein [bacterium]